MIKDVTAREEARFLAMIENRLEDLAGMLDDSLIYVHSNGLVENRADYLAGLARGVFIYHRIDILASTPIDLGDAVILNQTVAVRMTIKALDQTVDKTMNASSVWRKGDGGWRLVLLHSTALP